MNVDIGREAVFDALRLKFILKRGEIYGAALAVSLQARLYWLVHRTFPASFNIATNIVLEFN